jgi:hypothetical protein
MAHPSSSSPPPRPKASPRLSRVVLNNIAAIVLGVIVANVVILVTEVLGTTMYPMAAGADPRDEAQMRAWMQQLPGSAFALVLFGWVFGAFMGGVVAGRIERVAWVRNALILGALLLGGSVLNMRSLPHPPWMWVAAFLSIVPAAYVGGRIGATR